MNWWFAQNGTVINNANRILWMHVSFAQHRCSRRETPVCKLHITWYAYGLVILFFNCQVTVVSMRSSATRWGAAFTFFNNRRQMWSRVNASVIKMKNRWRQYRCVEWSAICVLQIDTLQTVETKSKADQHAVRNLYIWIRVNKLIKLNE